MNNTNGWDRFFRNGNLPVTIAFLTLAWAVFAFFQSNQDAQKQISQQQTQIALADQQYQLMAEQGTLAVQQFNVENQLLTPSSFDNENLSLTATAFIVQIAQIESTMRAIATEQRIMESAPTATATPLLEPLVINGNNFSMPNPASTFHCVAQSVHTQGSNEVRYDLIVPKGWVMAWDSFKASWPGGGYDSNGLLVIFGPWEGQIRVNTGGSCSGPVEWLDQIVANRCADYPNVPSRQAYTINMPSSLRVRDCSR